MNISQHDTTPITSSPSIQNQTFPTSPHHLPPYTHAPPPMHRPMQSPACPSTKYPIPWLATCRHRDYMILLLVLEVYFSLDLGEILPIFFQIYININKANIMSSNMIHQMKKKKRKFAKTNFINQLGHFTPY